MKFTKLREWRCNNQCKHSCCNALWLKVTPEQRASINKRGYFIVDKDYIPDKGDWRWVEFHKQVKVEKQDGGMKKIIILKPIDKILYNPFQKCDFIYIEGKCNKLMKDGRCKIYRNRPNACKVAECPVFSENSERQWFAENSYLKEQLEKYRKGELKKWET